METYPACVPCITKLMELTLEETDLVGSARQAFLDDLAADLSNADRTVPPARTAGAAYQKLLRETGQEDIFRAHKRASIDSALELYPRLKSIARDADDPLEAAIRISALGNILDAANTNSYNLDQEINRLLEERMWGECLELFRSRLAGSDSLLILADNAAETVFDKVLIETVKVPVLYAVKSAPAYDDALVEDARRAGVDKVAQIIETGTPFPGTYLPSCSETFQELFRSAPLVLAKGQANYETLDNASRELFFLLKVKCEVVSQAIGYPLGSLTFKSYAG